MTEESNINNTKFFYTSDGDGDFNQFSIDDQALISNSGKPFKRFVNVMVKTPDEKYLYLGCSYGYLYQWSIEQNEVVKDFGNVHDYHIYSMEITKNGKYLLTGDCEGELKQFLIKDNKLIKVYICLFDNNPVEEIISTSDSKR